MGIAIARELQQQGAEVILVTGPVQAELPGNGIIVKKVKTAAEMFAACMEIYETTDIAIMSAAVADYTPVITVAEKIKKKEDGLTVELTKTKDILKELGEKKRKGQVLVGFALETNNEQANAKEKLVRKNADLIVLNSLNDSGAGFGHDTNKVTIFGKGGQAFNFETKSKQAVAKDIVDTIIRLYYA